MPEPGSPGRHAYEPDVERARALARKGLNNQQIAACLGIASRTFYRKKRFMKAFDEAIEQGRAEGVAVMADALVRNATALNNVQAQIYFLRSHGGPDWNDRSFENQETTGTASNPLVIKLSGDGNSTHKSAE